jgi:hypothetical protein
MARDMGLENKSMPVVNTMLASGNTTCQSKEDANVGCFRYYISHRQHGDGHGAILALVVQSISQ